MKAFVSLFRSFTVTRTSPVETGGTLHETRSSFRVATFGKLQEVITAGAALTDADARLRRLAPRRRQLTDIFRSAPK